MKSSSAGRTNHIDVSPDELAEIDRLQIQETPGMISAVLAVFRSQRVEGSILGLDAEDIVSNIFVRYREKGLPANVKNMRAYLRTAARHDALDQLKVKGRDNPLPDVDTTMFISGRRPGFLTMPGRTARAKNAPLRLDDEVPTRRKES